MTGITEMVGLALVMCGRVKPLCICIIFYKYLVILKVLSTRFGFIGVYTDFRNLLESSMEGDSFKSRPIPNIGIKESMLIAHAGSITKTTGVNMSAGNTQKINVRNSVIECAQSLKKENAGKYHNYGIKDCIASIAATKQN